MNRKITYGDSLRNDPSTDRRLTVREASKILGLAEVTIRAWIARRRIGYVRLGRSVRIPLSEIQRLLDAGTVPPRPESR